MNTYDLNHLIDDTRCELHCTARTTLETMQDAMDKDEIRRHQEESARHHLASELLKIADRSKEVSSDAYTETIHFRLCAFSRAGLFDILKTAYEMGYNESQKFKSMGDLFKATNTSEVQDAQ